MLKISHSISISPTEIELLGIRAQGAGGQNVNKVSTAIHLRFNIRQSSLPEDLKTKVMALSDYRISSDGIIVIKAQRYRSQEKNKEDALNRLVSLIRKANKATTKRVKTKPSKSSIKKRLESKKHRSTLKKLRQNQE